MTESEFNSSVENEGSLLEEPRKPAIKRGWLRAVLFFIAAIICSLIFGVVGYVLAVLQSGSLSSILDMDHGEFASNLSSGPIVIIQFFTMLGTFLAVWVFRRFIDRRSLISLGFAWNDYRKDFLSGSIWGVGMIAAGFGILYFLGNITIVGFQFDAASLGWSFVLFIVVALTEEIMVRGYFLANLMDSMNKYVALFVSAIVFFLMHGTNPNMGLLPAVNLFLAGIVLGIYYIYQRNLWFSIGMHLTWNFFQGPIFGFEVSGHEIVSVVSQEISGSSLLTGGAFGFEGSILETIFSFGIIAFIVLKYRTGPGKTGDRSTLDYS